LALGKVCAECLKKVLDKEDFANVLFAEPSLPSATLDKVFAECFSGFRHSAKLFPVVYLYISMHIYMLIDLTVVTVYL
jgi:hypothetical protein